MNKKFKIFLLAVLMTTVIAVGGLILNKNMNTIYINLVLSHKSYSYLPTEAKEFIKEIYEETGEVLLTEKNKKDNKLYLNPQYVEYLTYSEEEKDDLGEIPISMIIDYSVRDITENINVPSKYDLRNDNGNNYVTPVRDQGDLGLCWTFATAGAAESHLLKKNNISYTSSSQLISERQIDYATSRNGIKDYKSEYVSFINRSLGDGGNFYISTIALANGISLIDYNSFKEYNDDDLQKMELSDVLSYSKSLYEVNSTINFPRLNLRDSTSILSEEETETRNSFLKEVKQNIMENGAAYVRTLMDSSCRYVDSNLNNTVIDVYNCNPSGGHAMEIIGWDDDLEYSYCADTRSHNSDISDCRSVVSGKGVWILKNSWGDVLQYPYLTYDSLYTSIFFINEVQSSQDKNWDNNYILGSGSENVKSNTYTLADTKIKNNEIIKKVKFITENSDTEYNVKIKKIDGTYSTFTKMSDLPGLMTFDITEDILVNKNTEIIVYSENGFIDKVSIFTSNENSIPNIDLSKYDNMLFSDNMRLYSETKNIPSGSIINYKFYNSSEEDVSSKATFTNNIVAENNINTLVSFSSDLDSDVYRIDAIYNSSVIGSVNINIVKMEGLGTKDNPYIITNSSHLYQIRNDLDAYYELGNDIDLTEDTREGGKYSLESNICPQGFGWNAISGFSGSLDGKGHTIKGLYQNNLLSCNIDYKTRYEANRYGNGLFESMEGNATVKNIILEDFDINCYGGYCGALVSTYYGEMNDYGDPEYIEQTEFTATFENIAIKNSKMSAGFGKTKTYGGGLFGMLESTYGNINISNIYIDIDLDSTNINYTAYLASGLTGKVSNVQNIRLLGDLQGKNSDGSNDSVLIFELYDNDNNIKNIISTVTATNVMGSLLGNTYIYTLGNLLIDGINILNIEDKPLCSNDVCLNATNVNVYDKNTQLVEFTKQENYDSWTQFDSNWEIKTIDGIPRIPTLKFMDFEYTSISDIILDQVLNEKVSIYDYLTPKINAAKRISYKSNNEEIVKLGDDGTIIPQSTGNTTIHVESLYDGYIKDVPIQVTYVPHYDIHFVANGGTGEMESIEVQVGNNYTLPENKFEKENYVFNEWNTKADGTGIAYSDLSQINAMDDKESITLYAQWIGVEIVVKFDASGGMVSPDRKIVRYGEKYGELPIPTKAGNGFGGWLAGSVLVDAKYILSGNNLRAAWYENGYTLIYDANGGIVKDNYNNSNDLNFMSESVATTYGINNKTIKLSDVLYEKEGYMFKEWNTKADGTGTSYDAEESIEVTTVENDTLRLYAIWENVVGTITYNSNYGDNQTKTQTFTFNVDTKLDKNTFSRTGFIFKEWNTEANGSGTKYSDEQTINVSKDLTLYAIWENVVGTITYNSNYGDNQTKTQTFTFNVDTKLDKNTFSRTGFIFKEWNTEANGSGTKYSDEQTINVSKDLTLYAIWEETFDFVINNYDVDENNKYISKIMVNTEVNKFTDNIILGYGYGANVDSKTINNKQVLYTGGKTRITYGLDLYREYTNIVIGDINGDGALNSADLLKVRQHLLGINVLSGVYFLSSDVNYDNTINSADLLRVRQHLLGTKPIE